MEVGTVMGLHYIELSISSPICNASGALVATIAILSGTAEEMEAPKYIGAAFETAGQLTYIFALANGESALAAPIISSYCVASVLWSRLFLKEKLSLKHYACIATTIVGIIIMGVFDM